MDFSFFSFPFFPIAAAVFLGFILYLIFSPSSRPRSGGRAAGSRSSRRAISAHSGSTHSHSHPHSPRHSPRLADLTTLLQGVHGSNPKLPVSSSGPGSDSDRDSDNDLSAFPDAIPSTSVNLSSESKHLLAKINSSHSKYSSKSRVNFFLTGKTEATTDDLGDKQPLILIVDDSRTALLTAKQALKNTPYRIATALGGNIAWEKMLVERPNLVITDYDMPHLNGMQLLQRMREDLRFLDIPVLMVSVNPFSQIEAGRQCQVNGFLAKPYAPQDLKEQIGYFLRTPVTTYH